MYIYIPMPGGSFDVGGALSKPYALGGNWSYRLASLVMRKVTDLASRLFWIPGT